MLHNFIDILSCRSARIAVFVNDMRLVFNKYLIVPGVFSSGLPDKLYKNANFAKSVGKSQMISGG